MSTVTEVAGFQLVNAQTGKEVRLVMQHLHLVGKILPIGGRLVVQHTFSSQEAKPLEVIYSFPLPRDAALRRFRVTGKEFSVHSQLKPVEEAVKAYEEGIEQGHLSTLVRQYRDGMVNLNLGNLQPNETVTVQLELLAGVELHDRGFRFRFPFTLAPTYHSRAKSMGVDDGTGEIELPEDEFGDLILPQFKTDATILHQVGFDLSVTMPQPIQEIGSPSHAVRFRSKGAQEARVSLAQAHDVPNRDLVLDVRTSQCLSGVLAGVGKDGKGHFAAVFSSETFGQLADSPRRVVFVLDRSGSMGGAPIEQAKKAVEACLGALSDQDQFGLVAFDNQVEIFHSGLAPGSMENRESLRRFLQSVNARGGTELAAGFLEAARLLGKSGGDVMLLTDGQVSGTEDILQKARSAGIRIHALGIGSASQDRFLSLLSEQTGGVCRFLTPRERVDLPAVDLFASIRRPVAIDVRVKAEDLPGATILPEPPSMVFSGNPLVVFGESSEESEGQLRLAWEAGDEKRTMVQRVSIQKSSVGDTLRLIRGAKLITDLESRMIGSEARGVVKKREEDRLTTRLEALSQSYGLASRQMALVAIVERAGDKPGQLPETRVVPVGMPQDVQFNSYFTAGSNVAYLSRALRQPEMASGALGDFSSLTAASICLERPLQRIRQAVKAFPPGKLHKNVEDVLLELAASIEPDGGMSGPNEEQRVLASLVTLLFFIAEGHTSRVGTFRNHVLRLVAFLQSDITKSLSSDKGTMVKRVCEVISEDRMISGNWSTYMEEVLSGRPLEPILWTEIEQALGNV